MNTVISGTNVQDLFNNLLLESLVSEKKEEQKQCLISGEILEKDFINLLCNHSFNYQALFKEIQTQISHDRYKRFVGTKQTLLVENYSKKTNNFMTGKIDGGQTTHISSKDIKIGDYVNVLITEASPFALKSELI